MTVSEDAVGAGTHKLRGEFVMFAKVIVGIDGLSGGRDALALARELAGGASAIGQAQGVNNRSMASRADATRSHWRESSRAMRARSGWPTSSSRVCFPRVDRPGCSRRAS